MSEEPSEVLSVVASDEGNELSVHMTLAGLDTLIAHLSLLRRSFDKEGDTHSHLMSESWGVGDLTETMLVQERDSGASQVHHVKLYLWSEHWARNHGLTDDHS